MTITCKVNIDVLRYRIEEIRKLRFDLHYDRLNMLRIDIPFFFFC